MKLFIIGLVIALCFSVDPGNIGRYEVEVSTQSGETFNAFITVATYDALVSEFSSDAEFKDFLFNVYGWSHLDSLTFFKKFYYINYPEYQKRKEQLTAVLKEDRVTISKSDISKISFRSLTKTDFGGLKTALNIEEVKLLKNKPQLSKTYTIDPSQEGYTELWLLSYNKQIDAAELDEIVRDFKLKYTSETKKRSDHENSWTYERMLNEWKMALKKQSIYLIEVMDI
jgi:hypothetical protein